MKPMKCFRFSVKTARSMPREQHIGPLSEDYARMEPMFFSEPPPFQQILTHMPELENPTETAPRSRAPDFSPSAAWPKLRIRLRRDTPRNRA